MLVKIMARHSPSYKSLLSYILKEAKEKDKEPNIITHNLRGENIEGWTKEYIQNEAVRNCPRSDSIYLYHEIVSVSANDKNAVTNDMITDLTKQYISLRGDKGVYLAKSHYDKDHIHIHFAVSGLEYRTGKAFRLSKENLHDLKTRFQEYHREKYPELEKSFCDHGKGKQYETAKEWQARNKEQRSLLKDEIFEKVHSIYSNSTTQKDFLDKLRDEGLHHYERANRVQGIEYEDMKFRFSRLDIDMKKLNEKEIEPNKEKSDEDKALDEIRSIRESRDDDRDEKSKDDDQDDRDMDDDDDFDR